METTRNEPEKTANEPQGQEENQQSNYTSLPSDGPVSESETGKNEDLEETDKDEETEQNAGDLAANALGNKANDERD